MQKRPTNGGRFLMILIVAIGTLVLGACNAKVDLETASAASKLFHENFEATNFEQIYDGASADFKKTTSKADFVLFLTKVSEKLGKLQSADQTGWNVQYLNTNAFIYVDFKTTFEKGVAVEKFGFVLRDKSAELYGYNIQSNAFILN